MPTPRKSIYYVSGICCSTEEAVMKKKLDATIGFESYSFNPVTSELSVEPTITSKEIARLLDAVGFSVRSKQELEQPEPFWKRHRDGILTTVSAVLLVIGLTLNGSGTVGVPTEVFFGASMFVAGLRVFLRAWKSLRIFAFDMNVLMSIAALGAVAIGRWEEGAAVMVLFSVSLMLESYSAARTRRAVQSLLQLSPENVSVLRNGKELLLSAKDVHPNELLIVRPGERVPLDGIVIEGSSSIDQSLITGESTPIRKEPGDEVFAGSINRNGSLKVLVTHDFEDSTVSRMIHLVEDAQKSRAPIQSFVDRFAQRYTPSVLVLSVIVAVVPPFLLNEPFWEWFYRALVLLVIACPCALVISTPVTLVSALTNAARRGILIKGGNHIETLSKVRALAFDKTGTLTEGKHVVTDILPLQDRKPEDIIGIAAAMEAHSEHHLASAIVAHAAQRSVEYEQFRVEEFESIPGKGIQAVVNSHKYSIGSHDLFHDNGRCSEELEQSLDKLSTEGKNSIVLFDNAQPLGIIALQDSARQQSKETIERLQQMGLNHIELLSGDNDRISSMIGDAVGVKNVRSQLLPEQKVLRMNELFKTYGDTAMIGDGVNDAPALAASSVGIVMGVTGSDVALESADVVLMSNDIGKLPHLFSLSKKAIKVIKQNIALALGLKLVFLLLSISGWATLWMAVLADDGAALLVILNGLRLLQFDDLE